jgi:20S proteasome alpha/beta subunit
MLPKPPRLPERKRMTFIVGLKCTNGLVIGADSLETDGLVKRYRHKVEFINMPAWGLCWAAASLHADAIDKFSADVKESCSSLSSYDRHRITDYVEAGLLIVQAKHQVRMDVVIGLFGLNANGTEFNLYRASSNPDLPGSPCLAPEKEYHCVGMNDSLAQFILKQTYMPFIRVSEGVRLATFSISVMSNYAHGVEAPINVWSVTKDKQQWEPLLNREINAIEQELPVSGFEHLLANYWNNNRNEHFREWCDEENAEQFKQSASEKSGRGR